MLLSIALGPLMAQSSQTPDDWRGWLNQGVQAFKSQHYSEAATDFQKAVDLSPNEVNPRLYLATAYMQQYIPGADSAENLVIVERAEAGFRAVLTIEADNRVALESLAALELNERKFDEARVWYQRLIKVDPTNDRAYYSMGFIAWSKWYPAYITARVETGMSPEGPGPIRDAAVRRSLRSQYWQVLDDGIWNLNKALDLNPQEADAMAYLNLLTRERADLRDTKEEYDRDIREADQWMEKATEIRKMKAVQGGMVPPPPLPSTGHGQGGPGQPSERIIVAGSVQQQKLVSQMPPVYPPLARQAGIHGNVKLTVVIAVDGGVRNIQLVSGHPLLVPAALEAVKQWRYQPTLLNGAPVEVSTTIDVNFTLSQ
jgi:TonB family protein